MNDAYLKGGLRSVACPSSIGHERIASSDLVALALHQLLRARLEVEAQERLGVRGAHVHVPVLGVDRDAVEVADLALAAEALLELLELAATSGTGVFSSPVMK